MTPEQTLKQYFGYDQFRPLQKDIVQSVLDGKPTIALLPTGGGKSLCFQVPALMLEGVCVVVTPLIALMKDQVENLMKRDIQAVALYSGMKRKEIEFELENCINGKYKFLYVSPERLKSKHFIDYAVNIKVSLLAIDEAHCISQWGYDFRPPYLEISEFISRFNQLKVIALTASATKDVVADIALKLELKQTQVFVQSFVRSNLSYVIRKTENKLQEILKIAQKLAGSGLVYVKSRRKAEEISRHLNEIGLKTDYYHAGLPALDRNKKQEAWKQGHIRIMVCTNAFGMGIDKPDVRFVIHEQKPDTLEAYYQEAGRAGRDGNLSYCILLFHESDRLEDARTIAVKYPKPDEIIQVYEAIHNYLKIAVGSGQFISYDFDISDFCSSNKLSTQLTLNAIKILENEAYFQTTESIYLPSRLKILCDYETLNEWQQNHTAVDVIFKMLLRSYGGLFDFYTNIYESEIARRLKKSESWLKEQLLKFNDLELIDYIPQTTQPQLVLLENRLRSIHVSSEKINKLRERYQEKLLAVNQYIDNNNECRTSIIVQYFGEEKSVDCGICDVCLRHKRSLNEHFVSQKTIEIIKSICLTNPNIKEDELMKLANITDLDNYVLILRWLKDYQYIIKTKEGWVQWNSKKQ